MNEEINWRQLFDDKRERDEIGFNRSYLRDYHHGTNGHNERMIMAKLSILLDKLCEWPKVQEIIEGLVLAHEIDKDKPEVAKWYQQ